jgi:uncharacterized membrane protein SpoIIM required for sporulation
MKRNRGADGEDPLLASRRPLFDRKWLILVLSIFVLEVAFFAVISSIPVSAAEADPLLNDTQGILAQIQNEPLALKAVDIFANNARIAVLEFVPFFGLVSFAEVTFSTGQVISALAYFSGVSAALLLVATFLSPHAWIELMAYAAAVAESVLLVYSASAGHLRAELSRAAASLALVMLMLMFAAFLEAITVEYSQDGFLYAWGVAIVAALAFYWLYHNARPKEVSRVGPEPLPPSGFPFAELP